MCEVLPQGLAVSVLKSVFQEVHVQSLLQMDRHTVYVIITNVMKIREEELKSLGADFTFGFIQVMDSEKDPRNLLVAFQIVQDIITKNYTLGPFAEELFEVTSCYFPIDFTPPPSDPHGITRDDLILGLRAVLASTPRFAEFLLPLLIEKMDSDVQSAKLDSLQTLKACFSIYEQKELKEFLPSLWSSIRREVFQTSSERIEAEGLAALHALSACLSRSVLGPDAEDSLQTFLNSILQDCKHHLCEPDMKLVWPSAKLLQAAAGASYRAYHKVTASVLPLLLEQYNQHVQSNHRRTILEMTLGFLKLQSKWQLEEDENGPENFKDALCSMMFSAVTDSSTQLHLVAVRALSVLGMQQGFLSPSDIELVVDHLTRLILQEMDSQSCHLLQHLLSLSLSGCSPFSYSAASKCFAGLINKCPTGNQLDEILQSAARRIESGLADGPNRTQAITLLVWVTKALILRYHPLNGPLTNKVIYLLSDRELGPLAADMFSLLVSDSPDILSRACHADIRIMFRQRFFTENVPKLVEGFNSANKDDKPNYLKALSHVLNSLPKQVLMTELPSLLSLLLEALSCPDRVVQLSTLTCLEPLLVDAAEILSVHMDTLITKLISLISSPTMDVRITALKCVHALTQLPLHMLLPHKQQVIRALAKPLDDKKRLVRKEAVAARGQWFFLGSPGS
ncbi:hypothetical protein FKM82_014533 [Ascaphus truei]